QQTDHCQRNRAIANEIDLSLEDVVGIVIKTDYETGHHFHSVALNLLNRFEQIAAVLRLLGLFETFFHRRFDSEEHAAKASALHIRKQSIVFSKIHTRFGAQSARITVFLLPLG